MLTDQSERQLTDLLTCLNAKLWSCWRSQHWPRARSNWFSLGGQGHFTAMIIKHNLEPQYGFCRGIHAREAFPGEAGKGVQDIIWRREGVCDVSCSVVPNSVLPSKLFCPWNSPGKNTAVGCHSLLQGIFPIQGLNLDLLHCRQILNYLSH